MSWTPTPPFVTVTADLLHLRLRVERLKLAARVQNLPAHLQAFGVPEAVVKQALRGKAVAASVRYALPPIRHLEVRASGEF